MILSPYSRCCSLSLLSLTLTSIIRFRGGLCILFCCDLIVHNWYIFVLQMTSSIYVKSFVSHQQLSSSCSHLVFQAILASSEVKSYHLLPLAKTPHHWQAGVKCTPPQIEGFTWSRHLFNFKGQIRKPLIKKKYFLY